MERALVVIKPKELQNWGLILDKLIQHQFTICNMRMLHINRSLAEEISFAKYGADEDFQKEIQSFDGGPSVSIEVMRPSAVLELEKLFGSSSAQTDVQHVFSQLGRKVNRTATFKNSTLALIRPHAIQFGQAGNIIDAIIKEGFSINDAEMFNLERVNAEEFLEIYKGVVPEYHLMLDQLTSGPCLALEITGPNDRIVSSFREFVGPNDPSLAKQLRPNSLRARFGVDKVKNAVHCTDLEEDGPLEICALQ
ncbi:Nucleoside diphosphate kinase 7 [Dinochytrium kinnereticum]|nr:Nucleoside diphosphate kinase 7 [Dinochytrium kinnereticum]